MSQPTHPACLLPPDRSLVRPAPQRLLSLQARPDQRPLTPLRSTPTDYEYPSPTSSPTSAFRPSTSASRSPARPGAPQRAHSFCGDLSASTYALASAKCGTHLSGDKLGLVAPPLERTLSSLGSRGNCLPKGQLMARPAARDPSGQLPLTPPISPLGTLTPIPKILVSSASPTRPPLDPEQATRAAPSRPRSDGQPSGGALGLAARASPIAAFTPSASPCLESSEISAVDMVYSANPSSCGRSSEVRVDDGNDHDKDDDDDDDDDDDMMVVDAMVERVEELEV